MDMIELITLTHLAIHRKLPLLCGDVKQYFVKANLPKNEQYVVIPPAGLPNSNPFTSWIIKCTL